MKYLLIVFCWLVEIAVFAQTDSILAKIKISSTNLSEDFSVASSKSDELLLLIYSFEDDELLKEPDYTQRFTLKPERMQAELVWPTNLSQKRERIFFLIEIDSDKTSVQIDPVLRVYYKELIKCSQARDYLCIEKYLGDEDFLGYGTFNSSSNHTINGVYKLDKYSYTLRFEE